MVRVRATAIGYCDGYREIGDEFDVPDHYPVSPWWVPVPSFKAPVEETPEAKRRGRPPLNPISTTKQEEFPFERDVI